MVTAGAATSTWAEEKPKIESPRSLLPAAAGAKTRPWVPAGVPRPSTWTSGEVNAWPAKMAWDVPLMVVGLMMTGRGEARAIECTPGPGMAKVMVLPLTRLALRIAWRSDPGPALLVLVTTNDITEDAETVAV